MTNTSPVKAHLIVNQKIPFFYQLCKVTSIILQILVLACLYAYFWGRRNKSVKGLNNSFLFNKVLYFVMI